MSMKEKKLATFVFLVAATGIIIYLFRKLKKEKKLNQISNAGYEIAEDIYFPLKINRPKGIRFDGR